MSHKLIDLSPDLKRLRDEGYEVGIIGGYLLVAHIPYVTSEQAIDYGTLVSKLDLAGSRTTRPSDHVIHFSGQFPCNYDGSPINAIRHNDQTQTLCPGVTTNHSFSSKPTCGYYQDYYEKVVTYKKILSSQAEMLDKTVTANTFKVIDSEDGEEIFNYIDTNSSRAEIDQITLKLQNQKVAIIGLGGTGSYVLDFLAKTPVKEIHLFDADDFLQHNAFRAPGAAPLDILKNKPKKVHYLSNIYSCMHRGIISHDYDLYLQNVHELTGLDFVFICIDRGECKKPIIELLIKQGIPFIDVGMGVDVVDNSLRGSLRATLGTDTKHDHLWDRISFADSGDDAYSQNIQIAELNAFNAVLAVISWKKRLGFYHDLGGAHHIVYNIDINQMVNDDANP